MRQRRYLCYGTEYFFKGVSHPCHYADCRHPLLFRSHTTGGRLCTKPSYISILVLRISLLVLILCSPALAADSNLFSTLKSNLPLGLLNDIQYNLMDFTDRRSVEWNLLTPSSHHGFFHTKIEDGICVRWTRRVPPEALTKREALRFSLEREGGVEIATKLVEGLNTAPDGEVSFTKPIMKDGESIILKMEAMRDGRTLWKKSLNIEQYPPMRNEVTLRDDGMTLINGKPFFPLGLFSSPSKEFGYIRGMGFNSVQSYNPVDADYMKAAENAGLLVLPRLLGKTKKSEHIYHDPDLDDTVPLKYIDELKDSPALLGYYLYDEPKPGDCSRERLLALCDLVRRADPYHLATGSNNYYQAAYSRVGDIMMVDSYPGANPMDQLIQRMQEGIAAQAPNYGTWFIAQAFNPETHFTRPLDARHRRRPLPTFDEVRTMPWLAIALGAKGLFYYSFQTQGFYTKDAFPWFWMGFESSVHETATLLPWLTEREPEALLACDNKNVFITTRRRGNDWLVVAANSTRQDAVFAMTIPGIAGRMLHVVSESRTVKPVGDIVSDRLAPMETHIYVTLLEPAMVALPTLDQVRLEIGDMERRFLKDNPSLFTYRDGSRLYASWGLPDPKRNSRNVWYRMIDGYPGTIWEVGASYRNTNQDAWGKKDFVSSGRWIEVRAPERRTVNRIRAIVTSGVVFHIQIIDGGKWRTVGSETTVDSTPRHYAYASATTTAQFDLCAIDRFRIVFTQPKKDTEVVFELSAWRE